MGLFQLKSLSLAGNKFATLEDLDPLSSLPNLRDLDLFNCPVTEVENYRQGLFDIMPNLKHLDGFDVDDNEKEEDDEDEDEDDIDDDNDDDLLDSEGGGEESDLGEEDFSHSPQFPPDCAGPTPCAGRKPQGPRSAAQDERMQATSVCVRVSACVLRITWVGSH